MRYFIFILFTSTVLWSVDISPSSINITKDTEWLIDANHSYRIKDLNNENLSFNISSSNSIHLGFNDHTVWMRTLLTNKSNKEIRRRIMQVDPTLGKLDIYFKDKHVALGTSRKHQSPYVSPSLLITLKPSEISFIYFKIRSHETAMNIELWSLEEELHAKVELENHIVLGLFFGLLLALIIYNSAIFISIKDKLYLYYIIYASGILSHHLFYKGFAQLYLEPNEFSYLWMHPTPMNDAWMITGMIIFSGAFLKIRRFKIWSYLFYLAAGVAILNGLLMLYPPFYNLEWVLLWAFFVLTVLIGAGIFSFIKKERFSGLYLLGWVPLMIMFGTVLIRQVFGINWVSLFPHFEEFAVGFEATIFSIALSLRIKDINDEKSRVSHELIEHQAHAKEELKIEVAQKTKELQQNLKEKELLLAEVNHRVKNNMQMIISMLRLQADEQDEKFKNLVTIAENRIISLLSIHELIYRNKNFTAIDTSNYLNQFIDSLIKSFSYDKTLINIDIKHIQLDIDSLIQCTLIINELVTNSIKYAINPNGVKIYISMKPVNDHVELEVSDDGTVLEKKITKGFGISLTASTVKKILKGKLQITRDNGYKTVITFPLKKV